MEVILINLSRKVSFNKNNLITAKLGRIKNPQHSIFCITNMVQHLVEVTILFVKIMVFELVILILKLIFQKVNFGGGLRNVPRYQERNILINVNYSF